MDLLSASVMPYAWGSRTAIATLQGRPAAATPEAELWMGAHPALPSFVLRHGARSSLIDVITSDPDGELGAEVRASFGERLPFLLKVLAAAAPLSLQAHPTLEQAARGFDDEEARGVPRNAPHRNYKDRSHKPELLCALEPFRALSGFRPIPEILAFAERLGVAALDALLAPLRRSPSAAGLAETFGDLMTIPAPRRPAIVDATIAAVQRGEGLDRERALVERLAELYPGDIGIVSALLLRIIDLAPGQAIYLGAGNLHAYLEGTGIEIMASSDNVLRGGLTAKHVDVPELMRVLDFDAPPVRVLEPRTVDPFEQVYDTPAKEFSLSRLSLDGGTLTRKVDGPEILLVVDGSVATSPALVLPKGTAAFVSARDRAYTLRGRGTIFRARTNLAR